MSFGTESDTFMAKVISIESGHRHAYASHSFVSNEKISWCRDKSSLRVVTCRRSEDDWDIEKKKIENIWSYNVCDLKNKTDIVDLIEKKMIEIDWNMRKSWYFIYLKISNNWKLMHCLSKWMEIFHCLILKIE